MNVIKKVKILSLALLITAGIPVYIQPASAQSISGSELESTVVPGINSAYSETSAVTIRKTSASESLGVAAHLNEFYYNYPLFEGREAPASTLTVMGSAADDDFTGNSVNTFDISRNASFVAAPFNSHPALNTIPDQGLTMNINSDKNCVITNVDGYTLASMPNIVTVKVNNLGEVSVNDVTLWKAQSGYKIVGYLSAAAGDSTTLIEENLADLTDFIGVKATDVGSAGSQAAVWTLPATSLPGNFEEFLSFNVNSGGQLQPMVASYFGNNSKFASYSTNSTSGSPLPAGVFAPVEVAHVYANDKVAETSTITVSNPLNGKKATVTAHFFSSRPTSGFIPFVVNPSKVNEVLGDSQTITVSFEDAFGNSLANRVVYLETGIPGLWLTQVNGKTITGQVNIGTTSSPSIQTVNTPVPLFNLGAWASAPAYSSVTVPGLTAYHLNDDKTPVIALTTGDSGTVSLTLAEGDVTYVAKTASTTAVNSYSADPGTALDHQSLSFYLNSPSIMRRGVFLISDGATLLNWADK
ncbi:MAG: hypothetical protein P4L49_08060 [Desulfosporosinus sp.]|nr:hypothetical protein [Desulfosporosinus sp.]